MKTTGTWYNSVLELKETRISEQEQNYFCQFQNKRLIYFVLYKRQSTIHGT